MSYYKKNTYFVFSEQIKSIVEISFDIEKVIQGDPVAFRRFFAFFYPKLVALACRFVDRQTAKDLTQEVFIVYWEQKGSVQMDNIGSFLYKCIQNKCLNYLKRSMLEDEYKLSLQVAETRVAYLNQTTDFNDVLNQVFQQDLYDVIESSVKKLPPKCAEAFRLCYFQDMSYKQIAVEMDVSHRTVERYVRQAVLFLRKDLRDVILLFCVFLNIR